MLDKVEDFAAKLEELDGTKKNGSSDILSRKNDIQQNWKAFSELREETDLRLRAAYAQLQVQCIPHTLLTGYSLPCLLQCVFAQKQVKSIHHMSLYHIMCGTCLLTAGHAGHPRGGEGVATRYLRASPHMAAIFWRHCDHHRGSSPCRDSAPRGGVT